MVKTICFVGLCCIISVYLFTLILASSSQEPHYKDGEHNEHYHDGEQATPEALIQRLISNNDVMVFSKSYCPYCRRTKAFFEKENIKFNVLELDQHPQGSQIQSELLKLTGQRTVPNVFIKGTHLGGSDKTFEAHANGKLAEMLKA